MLYIKAGAANMAGAWFIHWRCGQCDPCGRCAVYTDRLRLPTKLRI